MKKTTISKPSIVKRKRRIRPTAQYKIENMEFFLTEGGHATLASIEKFADDQLNFITSNTHIVHMNAFCLTKGVDRSLYHEWVKKSGYLKKRHEIAREIIGLRRQEKMALHNPATLAHTLYKYCQEWAEADLRQADLKKKDDDRQSGPVNVYITPDEKVEEVKERIPDKEDN